MINAKTNIGEVQRKLQKAHKKTLFAESEALNMTAKKVASAQRAEANKVFDRPTPYTLNAMFSQNTKLGFVGVFSKYNTLQVELIPGANRGKFTGGGRRVNDLLSLQIDGGIRTPQKTALVVPTLKARKNKFGNLGRRYVKTLLSREGHVQLGRRDGVQPGIYRRSKRGKLTMLVAYEPRAQYRARFGYYRVAQSVFGREFNREFDKAFKAEMANL